MPDGFIPAHGGYRKLLSYQRAEMVYDATVRFCERFLEPRDRTVDQMVQAARSGKQNVVEGSMAAGTSTEMEVKLTGVARASLEELLADYRDFLRLRGVEEWSAEHPHARRMSELLRSGVGSAAVMKAATHADPVVCANVIIGLIKVTNYLLDQQIRRQEQEFVKNGGVRERMTQARLAERDRQRRGGEGTKETQGT